MVNLLIFSLTFLTHISIFSIEIIIPLYTIPVSNGAPNRNYYLPDLSQRVDSVKEENLKLKSENQVLGQYIENLMAASSVFQSTSPKTKKK